MVDSLVHLAGYFVQQNLLVSLWHVEAYLGSIHQVCPRARRMGYHNGANSKLAKTSQIIL